MEGKTALTPKQLRQCNEMFATVLGSISTLREYGPASRPVHQELHPGL